MSIGTNERRAVSGEFPEFTVFRTVAHRLRSLEAVNATRDRFGLTLMVNHACNLRCSYCYTGAKFSFPMTREIGMVAIERAFRSLAPGGQLDLSFFGGEPLLESARILEWMAHARRRAAKSDQQIRFNLTTNGTVTHREAWEVMLTADLDLAVSFDGNPEIHNRHRRDAHGHGTAATVEATLRQLIGSGKPVRVNAVVRPDTLGEMIGGLVYLHQLGVRQVDFSLDLWTGWTARDGCRLEQLVQEAGALWRQWLPEFSLNWFDVKAGDLAHLPMTEETTRCGFGTGEVAVAPSGRLYPCERLIGEDHPDHPLRLPGHVLEGHDFLGYAPAPFQSCDACTKCALSVACDTLCRCSNFIRRGDVNHPDGLLCLLNKATARTTSQVLASAIPFAQHSSNERSCYAK